MIVTHYVINLAGNVRQKQFIQADPSDPQVVQDMHGRCPPVDLIDWQIGPDELVYKNAMPTAQQLATDQAALSANLQAAAAAAASAAAATAQAIATAEAAALASRQAEAAAIAAANAAAIGTVTP